MKNTTLTIASVVFAFSFVLSSSAVAQITPDTTLGANGSIITPNLTIDGTQSDRIDGGAIRGTNLFHSFQQFNIDAGRGAYFTNPDGITDILTRVTGANSSNINGTLGVLGNANLFLLNPNGIIFGSNARLDVKGSFVGTTANGIQFNSGEIFSANPALPLSSGLLNVKPSALLFNQIAVGAIVNRSSADGVGLQVPQGESLLLAGGDVSLEGGRLQALGGNVELAGVRGTETLGLTVDSNNLRLIPQAVQQADVSLTNGASVNVSGGGGRIAINAENLDITERSTLQAGIASASGSTSFVAGDIVINAQEAINLTDQSSILNTVQPQAVGNGGSINITTGSLAVTNGSWLLADTWGQGNAGSVNINASGQVSINGIGSSGRSSILLSSVLPGALGNSGGINITAESLSVSNGGQVAGSTFAQGNGNAGSVNINTRSFVRFDGAANNTIVSGALNSVGLGAVGKASDINITTGSLFITNGALVSTATFGQGNAGNVNIIARDTVSLDGAGSNGYSSGLYSSVETTSVGKGGDINITTGALSLTNGALLTARTKGQGNAGNITINANTLSAANGGQIATTSLSSGKAGNITVNASDSITLSGSSSTYNARFAAQLATNNEIIKNANLSNISAEDVIIIGPSPFSGLFANTSENSTAEGGSLTINTGQLIVQDDAQLNVSSQGTGSAGNLLVTANSIRLDNSGRLSAEVRAGSQGNITLDASDIQLRRGSNITTNATDKATGGNITINTGTLLALENSDITANAVEGNGGNITISTQGIFRSPNSDITAASQLGIDGVVQVSNFGLEQQNALQAPQSNVISSEQVVAGSCLARRNTQQGTFVVTGNGGLPSNPLDTIALPYELVSVQPVSSRESNSTTQQSSRSLLGASSVGNIRATTLPTTSSTWKLGDPIQPATNLVVTADGRTLLVDASTSRAIANPQDLTCQLH